MFTSKKNIIVNITLKFENDKSNRNKYLLQIEYLKVTRNRESIYLTT